MALVRVGCKTHVIPATEAILVATVSLSLGGCNMKSVMELNKNGMRELSACMNCTTHVYAVKSYTLILYTHPNILFRHIVIYATYNLL